jgi:HD-GYP domain-containing protein (c-di-GMP phosphodiesterase class II)
MSRFEQRREQRGSVDRIRPLVFFMKKHCETGYRIARATEEFAHVADDILAHHERWNGSGYPQGLKGEAIP